jgi:VWFA-related protein
MIFEKLAAGLVFAGCVLFAQSTPVPAAAQPQVHMRLMAVDSSNQPVTDLTADNFQITDQGKPQRIVSFRKAATAVQLAPHEFYNKGASPRTTVILMDLLNQERMVGLDSSKKIGKSLGQLNSGEHVYLYMMSVSGTPIPLHPIPASPGAEAADEKTWHQQAESQIQQTIKTAALARQFGMTMEDKVKKTYVTLETLAKDLSAFPGHREIVWVTDGVPQVYQEKNCTGDWFGDCALYVPHLSLKLAQADVAVYPVTYTGSPDANTQRDTDNFAASTGGRTFVGTDMAELLAQIGSEEKGEYTLAYQPDPGNWDQKFHKIKTTCDRKGVKIQTKNRYFALPTPEQKPPAAKNEDDALITALTNPADVPDIGLRVAMSPVAGRKAVHFAIHIDAGDLQLKQQGANFQDDISILFADFSSPGNLKSPPTPQDLQLTMTPAQHDRVLKEGLGFEVDHAVDPTIKQVRFVVYDHASNAYGSLSIPVADLAAPAAPAAAH